jgi:Bacterial protein of unknown function (DUF885)
VTLPADIKAAARLKSDRGEIYSDFDIKMDANRGQPVIEDGRSGGGPPPSIFRPRTRCWHTIGTVAKIIEPELPNLFRKIPVLLYGIRPIPPNRQANEASNALAPAPDYSAPGWFNLNTFQPELQVKYDKESLVLHEAVPGHIFQGTLARALEGLPDIRKFYGNSAYGEGWALYTESLGSQLGVYRDPYSHFGQLASERFRAVRLVVDTGIHEDHPYPQGQFNDPGRDMETSNLPPDAGKGRTYTSNRPDSSDWYASQRPSGEMLGETSLNGVRMKSSAFPGFG